MPQVFQKDCKIKVIQYGDTCAVSTFSMDDVKVLIGNALKKFF